MNVIELFAPYFDRYITINCLVPNEYYDYVKRRMNKLPVVDCTIHLSKCNPGSWLYVAVNAETDLSNLKSDDKLYVGSQTQDRMFRGDGLKSKNFHHAEMRAGREGQNLIIYLEAGNQVIIYRMPCSKMSEAVREIEGLNRFIPLLNQPKKHVGYWFEQLILKYEPNTWKWNIAGVERGAQRIFAAL
jgi:hypothetical protein